MIYVWEVGRNLKAIENLLRKAKVLTLDLNGDDRFLPEKLELELRTLKADPEASLVYSNCYYIDVWGQKTRVWATSDWLPTGYVLKETFGRDWPRRNLYRNELVDVAALQEVGFYDESLPLYEDWDLKIRLASRYKVACCPVPLAEYRKHSSGLSGSSSADLHLDSVRRIREKNQHLLEALPAGERRDADRKLRTVLLRLEALAALQRNHRGSALKKYIIYLASEPAAVRNYKSHLRFTLPSPMFGLLRSAKEGLHGRRT